ncbi:MAG: hypothetical protein DRO09_00130 [Thermoprotei archaeon]|nr:MAG: hypothetical protein DRO09_00130 [Thermoprotei archaeon]
MFSWLSAFVAPFVAALGGEFWHSTMTLVIPPTPAPIDVSYIPDPDSKCLVIGLTFGDAYEYDPDTGTIGPEIYTPSAGVYHSCRGWMAWHWDPFVKSILMTNPYPQLGWCSSESPYMLRIVNGTDKYIWCDVTFWLVKFPLTVHLYGRDYDPEQLFKAYMESVVAYFCEAGKALGERGLGALKEMAREILK